MTASSVHWLLQRRIERLLFGRGQRNSKELRNCGSYAKIGDRTKIDARANVISGCDEKRLHLGIFVAVAMASCDGIGILRKRTIFSAPKGVVATGRQIKIGSLVGGPDHGNS